MIDPTTKLSVSRQAIMLGISRDSVYYKPRPVSDADLKLMHRIDKLQGTSINPKMLKGTKMKTTTYGAVINYLYH